MPILLSIETLEADKRYIEKQLAESDGSPWGTVRLMWESRLTEINQKIEKTTADVSNYASVALVFDGNPVIGSGDIRLDFATDALDSYRKLVASTFAVNRGVNLSERGRLPSGQRSQLFIRDIVRGSMGFILEEVPPEQTEMLPTQLKNAVEDTTRFITNLSVAADDEFELILERTQPRLVTAAQRFAKVLCEAGASAKLLGDERRLSLSIDDVARLSRRLDEVEISEESMVIDGVLLGILPDSLKFELRLPDESASTMEGAISDELGFKYTSDLAFKEQLLLKPVHAHIKFVRTTRNGRLMKERRLLEALEPA